MNSQPDEKPLNYEEKEKFFFSVFDPLEHTPAYKCPLWNTIPRKFDLSEFGSVIFTSKMQKKSRTLGLTVTRYYFLFEEYLAYGSSKNVSKIKKVLSLQGLKVWLPAKKQDNKKQSTSEEKQPQIGFFKCNKHFALRVASEDLLKEWLMHLSKRCIMCNPSHFYSIIEPLGKGSYGKVYLVENKEDKKRYAAKVIAKEQMVSKLLGVATLYNEINTLKKLSHSNIVSLKEVFETSSSVYLILEYVEGEELYTKLVKKVCFTETECIPLMKSLLGAVAYIHSKNIVHRDLKPENILIPNGKTSEVKIIDFGLANDISYHQNGRRGGTPGYIAPEVLNSESGKVFLTDKSDLFSVGCMLYRLLTGTKLFRGSTGKEILDKNKECYVNLNRPSNSFLSKDAKDLLTKLLEKDPEKRISAAEALEHNFFDIDRLVSLKELPESPENVGVHSINQYSFDVNVIKERNIHSTSKIIDSKGTIYFGNHIPFDNLKQSSNNSNGVPRSGMASLNNFDFTPNSINIVNSHNLAESSVGSFLNVSRGTIEEPRSKSIHFSTYNSGSCSPVKSRSDLKSNSLTPNSGSRKNHFKNKLSQKVLSRSSVSTNFGFNTANSNPKILLNGGFSEFLTNLDTGKEAMRESPSNTLKAKRKLVSIGEGEDKDCESNTSNIPSQCDFV